MSRSLLIDANLLVLWAVGSVSPVLIPRHKRLGAYVEGDYVLLSNFLATYDSVTITPNALTEASNLARQIGEPARGQIVEIIGLIAEKSEEIYVPSLKAVSRREYKYLGLSDAAILEIKDVHLLTDDLDLYTSSLALAGKCFNFTHLREAAGITS